VNNQPANSFILHTSMNCNMYNVKQSMTGNTGYSNCTLHPANQPANTGCSINVPGTNNYGSGFNQNGGGIYALLWQTTGIQIFFFPRNAIPSNLQNSGNTPTPETWGSPVADYPFGNNCSPESFGTMKIVINLDFCGGWASSSDTYKTCPGQCNTYVQNTPNAFDEAYWDINYLRVYKQ
jgi:hypothetical protein